MTYTRVGAIWFRFVGLLLIGAMLAPASYAKDKYPVVLGKIDGRPGKTLLKVVYGRGGQLGSFYDVDADGQMEFVALERDDRELALTVLEIDKDRYSLRLDFGKAAAAGLTAINLDDDDRLEFVVGYGERLEGLKRGVVLFAGALVGQLLFVPIATVGNISYGIMPVLVPNSQTDLYNVMVVDDDGSVIWRRDLRAEAASGASWDETRFKWVVPDADGPGATILITDDDQHVLMGVSAIDGQTKWTYPLQGDEKASKRNYTTLIDGDRFLPVLFSQGGRVLVLEPDSGNPIYDGEFRRKILDFPSWRVFRHDDERGFLMFGEDRSDLHLVSLDTGEVLWSRRFEEIIDIVPLPSGERFIAVMERGIAIVDASGQVVAEHKAPDKIKAKYPPIYTDLNGDREMELVFVSGKNILCWQLGSDRLRWETKMGGIVGGANPTEIYNAFFDIDGDGWLDIPARKGSGTGRWLSGDTGEILVEVGNGSTIPMIGDWDGNGQMEMFWYKNWYTISLAN
jgi:hypothetical protein